MRKKFLSLILIFFILLGMQIPAEARILIKDGKTQSSDLNINTYILDKWSTYPDNHIQNASPSIWVSQFNTGDKSETNCLPACTKMLANMNGILSSKSVEDISNDGLHEGSIGAMMEYLKPYGFMSQYIYGSEKVKQYLDWGNIVAVPTIDHARICIGYATRGDKLWFEVLDPAYKSASLGHQWIEESEIGSGTAITNNKSAIPWSFTYKLSDGSIKNGSGFYNSLYYFVPKSIVDQLVKENDSIEAFYKKSILSSMNYEDTKENTITNIDKVIGKYVKIGNDVYLKYSFDNEDDLQKEGNLISSKFVLGLSNAA